MDSDKEYVEVFEDEGGGRDKRGRPAQLRRYKDDAYRSATHMHARTHVPALCPPPLDLSSFKTRPALASCIISF